jgi:Protein of unknown function (DUF3987)
LPGDWGRPAEFVNRPALTVGLAVQPYVLAKAARVADFAGRGLLDRFLYSLPPGTVGYRKTISPPVPEPIRQRYDTTLRALAASFDRSAEPVTLWLSVDAAALFSAWRAEIEPRRRPYADLGHIQGWSSKVDGAVVRIAGLLQLAETIASGWDTPISAATMAAAIEIGRYLVPHALAVFDRMGADPRLEAARRIGRWIVATHQATFTKRDALRALRGQALFPTVERITAGLAVLEEHGWVRLLAPDRDPGRPPSRYQANPAIFLEAWTKWPELARGTDLDDVLSVLSTDSDRRDIAERAALARHRDAILALFDADPIGWRTAVMAAQVPRSGAIPLLLARPGIRFPLGSCCSCGDPLGPDDRYRCGPCVAAATAVLERSEWSTRTA